MARTPGVLVAEMAQAPGPPGGEGRLAAASKLLSVDALDHAEALGLGQALALATLVPTRHRLLVRLTNEQR